MIIFSGAALLYKVEIVISKESVRYCVRGGEALTLTYYSRAVIKLISINILTCFMIYFELFNQGSYLLRADLSKERVHFILGMSWSSYFSLLIILKIPGWVVIRTSLMFSVVNFHRCCWGCFSVSGLCWHAAVSPSIHRLTSMKTTCLWYVRGRSAAMKNKHQLPTKQRPKHCS